jgi:hypothetical protein
MIRENELKLPKKKCYSRHKELPWVDIRQKALRIEQITTLLPGQQ